MAEPKLGKTKNGEPMHYSVGAVIKRNDKYLLIDRAKPPLGFAGVAGHVDVGEDNFEEALRREIFEESGLTATSLQLIREGTYENECRRGIKFHDWYLYECETTGEPVWNQEETKSIGWYTVDEMKKLSLEPMWELLFKKIGIL